MFESKKYFFIIHFSVQSLVRHHKTVIISKTKTLARLLIIITLKNKGFIKKTQKLYLRSDSKIKAQTNRLFEIRVNRTIQ